jgi:MFS family permease
MSTGLGSTYLLTVALKPMTLEFGWPRQVPSLAYSLAMLASGVGGIYMGRWSDRSGMGPVAMTGALMIGCGTILAGLTAAPWHLYTAYGLLIGLLGLATLFAPVIANVTRWFNRRRGLAVGIVACGQSLAGAIWPPIFHYVIETMGWRTAYLWYGLLTLGIMVPVALVLRRRPPRESTQSVTAATGMAIDGRILGLSPRLMMALLCTAIIGCCVAMSLPIVHLVAHVTDLGHPAVRAAELLSLLLATSCLSRLGAGMLVDRIGGLRTLFTGSIIQATMLAALSGVDGLAALYLVVAVFGLGYGGIVACYSLILREYFPVTGIGARIAVIYLFGSVGMATGGWLGGFVFDGMGSYAPALLIGAAFNLGNLLIIGSLIYRVYFRPVGPATA